MFGEYVNEIWNVWKMCFLLTSNDIIILSEKMLLSGVKLITSIVQRHS